MEVPSWNLYLPISHLPRVELHRKLQKNRSVGQGLKVVRIISEFIDSINFRCEVEYYSDKLNTTVRSSNRRQQHS